MFLSADLPSTGPLDWEPCEGCYSLVSCDRQMLIDEENEEKGGVYIPNYGLANSVIKYCRACELNCPAGK